MEIEKNTKDEPKSGCCAKIPCCSTACRRCVSCIVCSPCILLGLFLCVILIWGASTGDSNPVDGSKSGLNVVLAFDITDPAGAAAGLNSNATLSGSLMDLINSKNTASGVFVSAGVSAKKQTGIDITVTVDGNQVAAQIGGSFDFEFTMPTQAEVEALEPTLLDGAVFTSQSSRFDNVVVKCTVAGITGNSFTKPLCIATARVVADQQEDLVKDKLADALEDYTIQNFGFRKSGRFWASLDYTGDLDSPSEMQELDCEIDTEISSAIEDVEKKLADYLSGSCKISLSDRNCKVLINDFRAFKDHDPICELDCSTCSSISGVTVISENGYLKQIATQDFTPSS